RFGRLRRHEQDGRGGGGPAAGRGRRGLSEWLLRRGRFDRRLGWRGGPAAGTGWGLRRGLAVFGRYNRLSTGTPGRSRLRFRFGVGNLAPRGTGTPYRCVGNVFVNRC